MNNDITKLVDNQAESGVIATLVIHPEFILHSDYLKAGYFFNQDNSCIYWAISELYKNGIDTIDAYNITNTLNSNSAVKKTVDNYNLPSMQEYISMCSTVSRSSLKEYIMLVNRVVELSFKRDLYKTLNTIQNDCFSDKNLSELNTHTYDKLDKLTEKYITSGELQMFSDVEDELWSEICKRRSNDGSYGIPSKLPLLNEYFTYEPTELVLVSGRAKAGKSAFMLNEAIDKLKMGIPTLYVDTEMSDLLFYQRVLSNLSGVEVKRIKSGQYSSEESDRIEKARQWIKKQSFIHIYDPSMSKESLYAMCKILKYKIGLKFVVYDYLKSNEPDSSAQYNILGQMCDFLKNQISGELELSVLAGAQLNRQGQVADSDKLERYCSVSLQWNPKTAEEYLSDGEDCGNYKLFIKLNRLGEQMIEGEYIDVAFDGNKMRIEQAEQHKKSNPF